jgi:ABC-2 type transport system permease protein
MNLKRVSAVAKKEFIQIMRDARSLGMGIFLPVFLLLLFGFALTLDVDNVPMAIWNQDGSKVSTDFILNLKNSRYFKIIGYFDNYSDLINYLDHSDALMAMVIPKDFSKYIRSGQAAPVQLLVDGSDSNTATIAMGYVNSVILRYNVKIIMDSFAKYGIKDPSVVDMRPRIWFNPDLKSRIFIIPGLIAVIMMIIAALLTSLTVAREWERGTMEQLISTPVRPGELILGKFIPYFAIGFFDLLVAVGLGQYVFNIPFRGSLGLLFLLSSLYLVGTLTMGIFISVVAKNQHLASQLAILSTFLPAFLLSGFMYPISNMPQFIQFITRVVPARYYLIILRGIYLKGVGFSVLWAQVLFLAIFGLIMISLAKKNFKKKVA